MTTLFLAPGRSGKHPLKEAVGKHLSQAIVVRGLSDAAVWFGITHPEPTSPLMPVGHQKDFFSSTPCSSAQHSVWTWRCQVLKKKHTKTQNTKVDKCQQFCCMKWPQFDLKPPLPQPLQAWLPGACIWKGPQTCHGPSHPSLHSSDDPSEESDVRLSIFTITECR